VLTLPLAVAALVLLGVAAVLPGTGGSWTSALLGSLILGACYFVLFLISQGFGFDDVQLALVLGTGMGWYGWAIVLIGTFAGYMLGALYGVGLMLAGRADRTSRIPFGPFLLTGTLEEYVSSACIGYAYRDAWPVVDAQAMSPWPPERRFYFRGGRPSSRSWTGWSIDQRVTCRVGWWPRRGRRRPAPAAVTWAPPHERL
jgi:hypothetical protein